MPSDRWLYAWGLGSVALGGASLLVPLYVVALGGRPFDLGLLASSSAFVGVPGALASGRLVERPSARRPIVIGTLVLVAAMLLVLPLISSLPVVIVANAIVWLAFAAIAPVLTLLVTVDVPESEWSGRFARLNAFQGWGWAGGLVAGFVWTLVGGRILGPATAQRTFFVVVGVCAAVAALLTGRWLPAEGGRRALASPRRVARALGRTRRLNVRGATVPFTPGRLYWTTRRFAPRRVADRFTARLALYFVAVALCFTGFAAFFAPLPAFLTGVGYGSDAIFALYLVSSLGSALFFVPVGRLTERYPVDVLQTAGLTVRAIALPTVAIVGSALAASLTGLLATAVVFLVVGLTWAVIAVTASTLVTRLAPQQIRGEALGIYTALTAFAGGVGALVGGWLAGVGYLVAFGVAAALVIVGAVLVAVTRRVPSHAPRHASS
ncbi:MAG: MFS transporter [Haloarculaceae archaeon]